MNWARWSNSPIPFAAATWAAFATWISAVRASEAGPVHAAALVAAVCVAWRDRAPGPAEPRLVRASWALLGAYAVLAASAPRFFALAAAFLALGVRCAATARAPRRSAGFFLLLGTALPFAEIAQAVLGVPLRSAAAAISALLLRGSGAAVESVGVAIRDGDAYFYVDPACGGLRFAWSALLLAGILSALFRLRWGRALALTAAAAFAAVLANALRTSALYWIERAPSATEFSGPAHAGVGVVSFVLAAGLLVLLAWRWRATEAAA